MDSNFSPRVRKIQQAGILIVLGTAAAVLSFAQLGLGQNGAPLPKPDPSVPIPAFHTAPPKSPLPDSVSPERYTDPISKNSYAMAGKVRDVLYQQPCYCYCDRNEGHHSLYDCFLSDHASGCNTCRMEAIFAYEQTRKGESAAQIRKEIIAGDWRKLKPENYMTPKDIR
ncbi:MAG TPA: CYCXC family (seleno)protein [Candidatus Acidoferrum sp.]|nr:CYCXC family (seleno)protein [Candidatus Acidoferrum sp.]